MANFNRRHYEAIAAAVQEAFLDTDGSSERHLAIEDMAQRLCTTFEWDNRLFNRIRFLAACVPGANVRNRVK